MKLGWNFRSLKQLMFELNVFGYIFTSICVTPLFQQRHIFSLFFFLYVVETAYESNVSRSYMYMRDPFVSTKTLY